MKITNAITSFKANKMSTMQANYVDKKLKEAKNVDIITHDMTDRDGANSALAMWEYLNNQGIQARVIISKKVPQALGLRNYDCNIVQALDKKEVDKYMDKYVEYCNEGQVKNDEVKFVPESEKKKKVLKLVPPGGCWIDLPEEIQKEYMGKSYYSGGGKRGMARRISWDEPCLTLTCSPSQKQTERCHPDETRPFTVREYARIQSFPDEWEFSGGIGEKYKQIGNAVPVELARNVGEEIVNSIIEYKNREEN